MLYTKSLRISSAAHAAVGVGAIVNLQFSSMVTNG